MGVIVKIMRITLTITLNRVRLPAHSSAVTVTQTRLAPAKRTVVLGVTRVTASVAVTVKGVLRVKECGGCPVGERLRTRDHRVVPPAGTVPSAGGRGCSGFSGWMHNSNKIHTNMCRVFTFPFTLKLPSRGRGFS